MDYIWYAKIFSLFVSPENSNFPQSDWETKTGPHQSLPQWIGKNCTDGTGKAGILEFECMFSVTRLIMLLQQRCFTQKFTHPIWIPCKVWNKLYITINRFLCRTLGNWRRPKYWKWLFSICVRCTPRISPAGERRVSRLKLYAFTPLLCVGKCSTNSCLLIRFLFLKTIEPCFTH